jgi:hypothetical protein
MRDALPAPVLHGERVRVRGSHMCEAVLITAERSATSQAGKQKRHSRHLARKHQR